MYRDASCGWSVHRIACLTACLFLQLTVASSASDGLPPGFPPPSSPARTLAGMKLADPELEVTLYAAEPLVQDPVCLAWDESGRVYVVEMADYPTGPPAGRIKLLEDSNADGLPDRATVFAEVPFPTGVFPWRGGVFVTAAPDLLYLKDTDGDGRADRRVVVFTGFTPGNQQHRVNGLIWGPDGWIWGANGDSGGQVRRPGSSVTVNIRGRDFRFDPLTFRFEAVPGQCQYGDTFDAFGHRYICNNSDHIRYVVFDSATLALNPYVDIPFAALSIARHGGKGRIYPISPVLPRFNMPLDAGRFSGACGVFAYRGGILPERYRDSTFVCDCVANLVHRDVIRWQDGMPVAVRAAEEQKQEFFAAADPWVRPVYVTVGPDGALYVCDMYRAVIEHPEWIPDSLEAGLDLRAGADRGRIYRIAPRGCRPQPVKVVTDDLQQLVRLIAGPMPWQQDTAYRLLVERPARWPEAAEAVQAAARKLGGAEDDLARLRLAFVLTRLGAFQPEMVARLLASRDPRVRAAALRLMRAVPSEQLGQTLIERLAAATNDDDLLVQREAAATIGIHGDAVPERARLLAGLLGRSGKYVELRTAVLLASHGCEAEVLAELVTASSAARPAGWAADAVRQLARAAARRGQEQRLRALVRTLPETRLVWLLELLAGWAEAQPGALQDDEQLRRRLVKLARRADAPPRQRTLAVRSLRLWQPWNGMAELIQGLFSSDSPPQLRVAAVELAGGIDDPKLLEALLARWSEETPAVRRALLRLGLASDHGRRTLLHLARAGRVAPRELMTLWPEARKQLADLLDRSSRAAVVAKYRYVLDLPTDRERGRKAFEKHCQKCHTVEGVGSRVGPELLGVRKRSPEALLSDILDPNAAVDPAYVNHVVLTKDGQVFSGIVIAETAGAITLRSAEGEQRTIPREDIEAIRATGQSLMPEGLEEQLTPQELADIIRYLREIQ